LAESLEVEIPRDINDLLLLKLESIESTERKMAPANEITRCQVRPYSEQIRLLMTISGINTVAATVILAELGSDISHFEDAAHLSSWAGLCPGNNESAGKRRSGRTTKDNVHLSRIMCECANAAIKTDCMFRAKYRSLVVRLGH
jgi:transposase